MKHSIAKTVLVVAAAGFTFGITASEGPLEITAAEAGAEKKGTGTCNDSKGNQLECRENVTYNEGRKSCYNDSRAYKYHWESNGPTCFEINNGDAPWPR